MELEQLKKLSETPKEMQRLYQSGMIHQYGCRLKTQIVIDAEQN